LDRNGDENQVDGFREVGDFGERFPAGNNGMTRIDRVDFSSEAAFGYILHDGGANGTFSVAGTDHGQRSRREQPVEIEYTHGIYRFSPLRSLPYETIQTDFSRAR
jgi:hypothetical protein